MGEWPDDADSFWKPSDNSFNFVQQSVPAEVQNSFTDLFADFDKNNFTNKFDINN